MRSRKCVASIRPRPKAPAAVGKVWAYDFVSNACASKPKVKCLFVTDECTRACLPIDVAD
jgi:hypothetical protein